MTNKDDYFIQTFASSPYHRRYGSPIVHETLPRRNSYQIAINASKHDRSMLHTHVHMVSSSSESSTNEPPRVTQSYRCTPAKYSCVEPSNLQRSLSQPAVRSPESDFLLENATNLLDSPVHALRPAHHKSRTDVSPTKYLSTRSSLAAPESVGEGNDCGNAPSPPMTSIYRVVIIRAFASAFALASLFSTEILQTSIYAEKLSFQALLTFHLCAFVGAILLATHASRIHVVRYRWTISSVLAYDRCSQILIVLATMLTGAWVAMQYCESCYYTLLLSATISGVSYSCMIVKTFDHILQLSTSLPIQSVQRLTSRLNVFAFIYNSICHLALTIGGLLLFGIILYQQYRREYILIGAQPCLSLPCFQFDKHADDDGRPLQPPPQPILINLTLHLSEKKQGRTAA